MPIPKSELIVFGDIGALEMKKAGAVKTLAETQSTDKSIIDLHKALMIKQFLAIKTDHKPIIQPIKKKKQGAEVIIILDD